MVPGGASRKSPGHASISTHSANHELTRARINLRMASPGKSRGGLQCRVSGFADLGGVVTLDGLAQAGFASSVPGRETAKTLCLSDD